MSLSPTVPRPARRSLILLTCLALAVVLGEVDPGQAGDRWSVRLQGGSHHGDWHKHRAWHSDHLRGHGTKRHGDSRDLLAVSRELSRQARSFDRVPIVPPFRSSGSAPRLGAKILTLRSHDDVFDVEQDVVVERHDKAVGERVRQPTGPKILIIRPHDGPFDPDRDVIVLRP